MEKKIQEILDITKVVVNVSLESEIEKNMKKLLRDIPTPKTYYYLTDLVNPARAYWKRMNPGIQKNKETARKLAHGTLLHNLARSWFRGLSGFSIDEGLLDGAFVGIPGVRGKVDYLLNNSIIEFKTKEELPKSPEEVISKFPQDLEQVVFYSVLHPSKFEENFLVFMKDKPPYELKAFKVITKRFDTIKSIIKNRIKLLDTAIEKKDPSKLGRCRYYNNGCEFHTNKICNCSEMNSLNTKSLHDSIEIYYDEDFTDSVTKIRQTHKETNALSFSTYDVLAPRKRYMRKIKGKTEGWEYDYLRYQSCLWKAINELRYSLNETERQELQKLQVETRIRVPFRWLKIPSSQRPVGEIVPYILNATKHKTKQRYPSKYSIAKLSVICATYNKSKGLIFNMYPKLEKFVRVFEVKYSNISKIKKFVRDQVDTMEKAEEEKDISILPPCLEFMNNEGKCPLMEKCHSEGIIGCKK